MLAEWLQSRRGYFAGWRRSAVPRRGIRVFRYHGVVERKLDPVLDRNQHLLSDFRAQMDYLGRFRVLSMAELQSDAEPERLDRRPQAMVTFDDGFFNNTLVADVMARRRMPWSVFVPSGEVGDRRAMWLVEVSLLLMRGEADRVDVLGRVWSLRTRSEREESFGALRTRLKAIPAPVRVAALDALRAQFPSGESDRLLQEFPTLRMLTWDELRGLASSGVEIGSHGVHHEIHHVDQPHAIREQELSRSRSEIEQHLGRPCRVFAFPDGRHVDSSAREAEVAGYGLAFTTEPGTIEGRTRDQRFALPRLAAPSTLRRFAHALWWEDAGDNRAAGNAVPRRHEA